MNFAQNLKKIRMEKTLSQTELSKKMGVEPSQISHYECGRRSPDLVNLVKLSKALGCTTDRLIFG